MRRVAHNRGLAKVAVQCSADTFVVNQSLVLRINICGEKSPPSPSRGTLYARLRDQLHRDNLIMKLKKLNDYIDFFD
jgi:hypothetical protein